MFHYFVISLVISLNCMVELVSGNGSASVFLCPAGMGGMCQYVTLSVPLETMMSCPITVLVYITVWRCSQGLHEPMYSMNTFELQHCLVVYAYQSWRSMELFHKKHNILRCPMTLTEKSMCRKNLGNLYV